MRVAIIAAFLLVLAACSAPDPEATRAMVGDIVAESPEAVEPIEVTAESVAEQELETSSQETVFVNAETSSLGFEGFGPGKSHVVAFTNWQGEIVFEDDEIVGGEGTIELADMEYSSERLLDHLRSEDFFDVENNPQGRFVITSIEDGIASGQLTLRGITRQISFPLEVTQSSIAADFVFDFTQFDWSYAGANDEVRIFFELNI